MGEPRAERRLQEFNDAWAIRFEAEARELRRALQSVAIDVHHVGSTAVPGMPGKGIIDILLTVQSLTPKEAYATALHELGYIERPVPRPDSPFFTKPEVKPRDFNMHIAVVGSPREVSMLAFRDYLRSHPAEASRYAEVKRRLARGESPDWASYGDGKHSFVTELERQSLEWVHRKQS